MSLLVLTVDQRASRRHGDLVPQAIDALAAVPALLPFERTAGDELQAVLTEPEAFTRAVEWFVRAGSWAVGVGAGEVDRPLPAHARAGRGEAYIRAREAVTRAKTSPQPLRVVGPEPHARTLESALWMWTALLQRRTDRGWEVSDLLDEGLSYEETGRRLGITQSAVSQRASAAAIAEGRRGRELVTELAGDLLSAPDGVISP